MLEDASSHQDSREIFQAFNSTELIIQFDTVHPWQVIIQKHQVRLDTLNDVKSPCTISNQYCPVRRLSRNSLNEQIADGRLILHYENNLQCSRFFLGRLVFDIRHIFPPASAVDI